MSLRHRGVKGPWGGRCFRCKGTNDNVPPKISLSGVPSLPAPGPSGHSRGRGGGLGVGKGGPGEIPQVENHQPLPPLQPALQPPSSLCSLVVIMPWAARNSLLPHGQEARPCWGWGVVRGEVQRGGHPRRGPQLTRSCNSPASSWLLMASRVRALGDPGAYCPHWAQAPRRLGHLLSQPEASLGCTPWPAWPGSPKTSVC